MLTCVSSSTKLQIIGKFLFLKSCLLVEKETSTSSSGILFTKSNNNLVYILPENVSGLDLKSIKLDVFFPMGPKS